MLSLLPVERLARAEHGFTLIELMVAILTGLVITLALYAILEVSTKQTALIANRVQANQSGRLTMTKVVDELHSACFAEAVAPVLEGSGPTKLIFENAYAEKAEVPTRPAKAPPKGSTSTKSRPKPKRARRPLGSSTPPTRAPRSRAGPPKSPSLRRAKKSSLGEYITQETEAKSEAGKTLTPGPFFSYYEYNGASGATTSLKEIPASETPPDQGDRRQGRRGRGPLPGLAEVLQNRSQRRTAEGPRGTGERQHGNAGHARLHFARIRNADQGLAMRMRARIRALRRRLRQEGGFTLILALGVMMVTSLLLLAAFTASNGDVHLAYEDLTQKQAYFAAQAGVQAYEYQLQKNPNFWQTCESVSASLPQEANTRYEVTLLAKTGEPKGTTCSTAAPFETVIESSGRAANTFRVLSTGYAGPDKRSIIATFQVKGFLDYVYFTHFEEEDPSLNNLSLAKCSVYHKEREEARIKEGLNCGSRSSLRPRTA